MTDGISAPYRTASRYWPIERLPELLGFGVLLFMTIRMPEYAKITTLIWLAFLAMLIVVRRVEVAATLLRGWPLLAAPFLAFISFAWSDLPAISARYGFQLLMTAFAGVLLARIMSPSRFITVLFVTMLVFCTLSLLSGRKGVSAEGMVLIGLVGSKNQMSGYAFLLVYTALATLCDHRAHRIFRRLALPGMAIGAFIVATTNSATGAIMVVASCGLFAVLSFMHPLPPAGRVGAVIAMALISAPLIALAPEIVEGTNHFIVNVLHKDPGLTGRAFLWSHADQLIAQRPMLGYGFQAFWLSNSPEARSLLLWAGQSDGRVFNFHHTLRQFGVDTGFVGMTVLAGVVMLTLIAAARQYIATPTVPTTFFFTLLVVSVARAFVEVLLVTFSTWTLLLFVTLTYAYWNQANGWGEDRPRVPQDPYPVPLDSRAWVGRAPVRLRDLPGSGHSRTISGR